MEASAVPEFGPISWIFSEFMVDFFRNLRFNEIEIGRIYHGVSWDSIELSLWSQENCEFQNFYCPDEREQLGCASKGCEA